MADKNRPEKLSKGKISYNESIVAGIVALAVADVEGVVIKSNKSKESALKDCIKIINGKDGIYVSVSVCVKYGYTIPDVAFNIQNGIRQNVEAMSKYKISKVDVFVSDVMFEEKTVVD